jgi:hypothetical protein
MNSNPIASRVTQASATSHLDAARVATPGRPAVLAPNVQVDVNELPLRDRVRWGPVVAGTIVAVGVLLFLTILGFALGISALRDNNPRTWGTAAGIWGGLSLLIAFFIGGWLTARSATTLSASDGPLNGFVTGAAILLILLWLATTAVTGALGFFVGTVADIAGGAAPAAIVAPTPSGTAIDSAIENPAAAVPTEANQAAQVAAQTASENAGPGAWGTTIAIVLAVGAATLGGMVGQNPRLSIPGQRTVVTGQ